MPSQQLAINQAWLACALTAIDLLACPRPSYS